MKTFFIIHVNFFFVFSQERNLLLRFTQNQVYQYHISSASLKSPKENRITLHLLVNQDRTNLSF